MASWEDRVRDGAYTSAGGTRVRFDFEEVGRDVTKRTTAFAFPGVNEEYVQDNGHGSRRYPLRCFFSGSNHDLEASAFEKAVLERGVGRLEHPLHGTFNVVPFGDITRRDDLKEAANQSVVEVTFWTTIGVLYPSSQVEPRSEIDQAVDGFNVAGAQQFANSMNLSNALNKARSKATIRKFLAQVSGGLQKVSDAVSSVNREFRDLQDLVNEGLDVFIGQPLLLAQQISDLIQAPGRALAGIEDRLEEYDELARSIFGSSAGNPAAALESASALPLRLDKIANDFHITDLFTTNCMAGQVVAVRSAQFTTRPQALGAAAALLQLHDDVVAWRDTGFTALGAVQKIGTYQTDTGEAYQAIRDTVALAAGFLVEVSFSLVPERRVVLDRARTPIDLAAELYGAVDSSLDFLIETNGLTGDEIFELPAGRSVVYYPS